MRSPSRVTLAVLVLLGLINLGRGAIHVFLPDSGAGTIAGFDLDHGGRGTVVLMLAFIGAGQLGSGLVDLLVAWRFRAFAAPLLAVELLRGLVSVWLAFVYKPVVVDYPGAKGMIVGAVVMAGALVWEYGRRIGRAA